MIKVNEKNLENECKHVVVKFAGQQETLKKDVYLDLYTCLKCSSTITINVDDYVKVLDVYKKIKR